jgi:hypothetical protein
VVFKVDQLRVDEGTGCSTKSGIVDANEAGAVGWYLSDDPALPTKFRVQDDVFIPSGG